MRERVMGTRNQAEFHIGRRVVRGLPVPHCVLQVLPNVLSTGLSEAPRGAGPTRSL